MKTIVVRDRQSLVDIAIQEYGSATAVIDLCIDNGLELDDDLFAGMLLNIQDSYPDSAIPAFADYLQQNNIIINSTEQALPDVLGNNDDDYLSNNDNNYLA